MKRMDRHCNIVLWTVMLFFYIPIAVLVVNSFNQSRFSGAWEGFTFKWYAMLFQDRDLWQAPSVLDGRRQRGDHLGSGAGTCDQRGIDHGARIPRARCFRTWKTRPGPWR